MFKLIKLFSLAGVSILLIFLVVTHLVAKQKVISKSFNTLLKTLLSHSVAELNITQVNPKVNYIFLDAREKNEYNVSHIKGAIWVGYKTFNINSVKGFEKNKPIIVYCSIGYRSEKIAEQLVNHGFTNVKNLYGGIFEWVNQSNVVYSKNKVTNKVHGFDKFWGVWLEKGVKVFDK